MAKKVLIMGAAGRDFHNFNVAFRDAPGVEVVAFTAAQIPNIAGRRYPLELAGKRYPEGIPIFPESELEPLVRRLAVDEVVFSYSDVSNQEVMTYGARANAMGADFRLLGTRSTMLSSRKPVISVCAVRTGCGKSQTARALADLLAKRGLKAAVIRHPMPYGDLVAQRCQRFGKLEDLDEFQCTIEEREKYELHIRSGHLLFAGVDYGEILARAEAEADVILWDGGNNDLPFYRPDFHVVLADPLRPGHETLYYPSEANVRLADLVLITKTGSAQSPSIVFVEENIRRMNPGAAILRADSIVTVENPACVRDKRVLVIEDGPTLTHGGMAFGAGTVAAKKYGALEIVDPRPFAAGSLRAVFEAFPHLERALPAMGYGATQIEELGRTIAQVPCDAVLVGTPFDLTRLVRAERPMVRVKYELDAETVRRLDNYLESVEPTSRAKSRA